MCVINPKMLASVHWTRYGQKEGNEHMSAFTSSQPCGLLLCVHVRTHLQGTSTTQIPQKAPTELSKTFYIPTGCGTSRAFQMKKQRKMAKTATGNIPNNLLISIQLTSAVYRQGRSMSHFLC